MLTAYQTLTTALLQASSSPIPLISATTLTTYINQARLQVAAQGRCIRVYATLPTVIGQRAYPFSAITSASLGSAVAGIYHIRQAWLQILGTAGQVLMYSRPFEWFGVYVFSNPSPATGPPTRWAQFAQGEEGSINVDPIPDLPYVINVDALGVPVALATDLTPEAIPDIWTLAVPFYAAWWAFQSLQRLADADRMMKMFQEQMAMARAAATPDLTPESWSQGSDLEQANRLGMQTKTMGTA